MRKREREEKEGEKLRECESRRTKERAREK